MPFVKLDCGILDSTLWGEDAETRVIFLTMLAMSGSTGLCRATAPGISRRANISLQVTEIALERLEAPDKHSRSLKHEGRRIERVDGGFQIINYLAYRNCRDEGERREYMRKYMADIRLKSKENKDRVSTVKVNVSTGKPCKPLLAQAEAEAEEESEERKKKTGGMQGGEIRTIPSHRSRRNLPAAPPEGAPESGENGLGNIDGLNLAAFAEWDCERRRRGGKSKYAWSPVAQSKAAKLMSGYSLEEQQSMVDASIANGWQGLFPPGKGKVSNNAKIGDYMIKKVRDDYGNKH